MWFGARRAKQNNVKNVALIWGRAEQVGDWFAKGEADQVWVQFPEPFYKPSQEMRRLTSPRYISIFRAILKEGGTFHFKTDVPELLEYTLKACQEAGFEPIQVSTDYFRHRPHHLPHTLLTYYEERHLEHGREVYYAEFRLTGK